MIRPCRVFSQNNEVTLVDFEGERIQMPATKDNNDVVYIKKSGNKYDFCSETDYKKSISKKSKKDVYDEPVSEKDVADENIVN